MNPLDMVFPHHTVAVDLELGRSCLAHSPLCWASMWPSSRATGDWGRARNQQSTAKSSVCHIGSARPIPPAIRQAPSSWTHLKSKKARLAVCSRSRQESPKEEEKRRRDVGLARGGCWQKHPARESLKRTQVQLCNWIFCSVLTGFCCVLAGSPPQS